MRQNFVKIQLKLTLCIITWDHFSGKSLSVFIKNHVRPHDFLTPYLLLINYNSDLYSIMTIGFYCQKSPTQITCEMIFRIS